MGAKFDQIFETVIQRFSAGGFLVGDVVKLKSNYKSSDCCKYMNDQMKSELDQLAKSGLNIFVTKIGDTMSGASAGNQFKDSSRITVTIAGDQGGGRYYGHITVTPDLLELVDVSGGLPVPDQFRKKDVVIIKPEKVEDDESHITRVTDKGNGKNTPTQLKLAESTIINKDTNNLAALYEKTFKS